ncbi:unnamed protein product [Linum tenue]|uniref:Uncharacterized protein n=1 Tax=Linum tenue TaxID=586396 RepID=A0AAV0J9U6_9ROSI|nr:unnamed protein product [Linum tenue]
MKASLKFRDEQKPLFRAKVPLSILGLPFQSGIVAGEAKELSLNLSTFFDSGPSFKVAYRPNDSWNPFSLVLKTGSGSFGSPTSSPMVMSAEFNLVGKGNPSFMLHFKPRFGDFSIKKSQASSGLEKSMKSWQNGVAVSSSSDEDGSLEVVEKPVLNGIGAGGGIDIGGPPPTSNALAAALSGVEVTANTSLPVRSHAVMSFRWGLRVPADNKLGGRVAGDLDSMAAAINFKRIPFLVMNKIGIEHVAQSASKSEPAANSEPKPDVAETCLAVKRQLDILQMENTSLKKAMDDLRREIGASKFLVPSSPTSSSSRYREPERMGARNSGGNRNEKRSSSVEGDVSEELKKALKGAAAAGGGGA